MVKINRLFFVFRAISIIIALILIIIVYLKLFYISNNLIYGVIIAWIISLILPVNYENEDKPINETGSG